MDDDSVLNTEQRRQKYAMILGGFDTNKKKIINVSIYKTLTFGIFIN